MNNPRENVDPVTGLPTPPVSDPIQNPLLTPTTQVSGPSGYDSGDHAFAGGAVVVILAVLALLAAFYFYPGNAPSKRTSVSEAPIATPAAPGPTTPQVPN